MFMRKKMKKGNLIDSKSIYIGPYSSENATLIWNTTGASVGEHSIKVIADELDEIPETNDENNELSENLLVAGAEADLVPSITISPRYPTEGENVTVNSVVRNQGGTDANNTLVEFLIDGVSVENKTVNVSALSETVVEFKWTAVAGDYNLNVKADADDSVVEWNETNNIFIIKFNS